MVYHCSYYNHVKFASTSHCEPSVIPKLLGRVLAGRAPARAVQSVDRTTYKSQEREDFVQKIDASAIFWSNDLRQRRVRRGEDWHYDPSSSAPILHRHPAFSAG